MIAGQRVVVVKPGDVLLIGNVGSLDDPGILDTLRDGLEVLKRDLGLAAVYVFEADIDLDLIPQNDGALRHDQELR